MHKMAYFGQKRPKMGQNGPNSLYWPIWAYFRAVLGLYMAQIAYIGLYWPINDPKIALFLAQKAHYLRSKPPKKDPKKGVKIGHFWVIFEALFRGFLP